MNRVKILRVSPELLVGFGQRGLQKCVVTQNPLPDDARIVGAGVEPNPWVYSPGQAPPVRDVLLYIESASFPELTGGLGAMPLDLDSPQIEDRCPHVVAMNTKAHPGSEAPHAVTLTRDQLAELLYDADRQPGRRVTLEVKADGTWEAAPAC